jgi:hypothetical protein
MVIYHLSDFPGLTSPIQPIKVIHQPAEDHGISHLTTNDSRLDLGTADEAPKFIGKKDLNLPNQFGPLIIEDIRFLKGLHQPVFSISPGRIADGQESHK